MSDSPDADGQKYKPVSRWFVFFMLRTRKGLGLMDKLGRWRISKPLAWVMLYLMPIVSGAAFVVVFLVWLVAMRLHKIRMPDET